MNGEYYRPIIITKKSINKLSGNNDPSDSLSGRVDTKTIKPISSKSVPSEDRQKNNPK
jgi:hypothetical protein